MEDFLLKRSKLNEVYLMGVRVVSSTRTRHKYVHVGSIQAIHGLQRSAYLLTTRTPIRYF